MVRGYETGPNHLNKNDFIKWSTESLKYWFKPEFSDLVPIRKKITTFFFWCPAELIVHCQPTPKDKVNYEFAWTQFLHATLHRSALFMRAILSTFRSTANRYRILIKYLGRRDYLTKLTETVGSHKLARINLGFKTKTYLDQALTLVHGCG